MRDPPTSAICKVGNSSLIYVHQLSLKRDVRSKRNGTRHFPNFLCDNVNRQISRKIGNQIIDRQPPGALSGECPERARVLSSLQAIPHPHIITASHSPLVAEMSL